MSSPVAEWRPSFVESLKLAWKPILAYSLFTGLGFFAFFVTILSYERGSRDNVFEIFAAVASGFAGILLGQLVALLRVRTIPVLIVGTFSIVMAVYLIVAVRADLPPAVGISIFFFCFAFPSGMVALHHRFELLGVFWPAVGWIGSVMVILNEEGRASTWEKSKVSAWLPIPLILLGFFILGLVLFMTSKQAMRVSNWQALSGAVERRVHKKHRADVAALPKKNLLPLLGIVALIFAFTAVISPYLWRTGKGDREGKDGAHSHEPDDRPGRTPRPPELDGEAILRAMQQAGSSAKAAAGVLWPLLLLALLYRPLKRAALTSHLVTPIFPTPPSERIDNLWEYVRIAAEDAGNVPKPSDSVEDFVGRIRASGKTIDELDRAAVIYERTRYGFTVAKGDAMAMKATAVIAATKLRKDMTAFERLKSYFRPLS
ncbi:MAG: hypothetical protein IPK71_18305 [Myxococcales bacterium]|nr:hypothetical protein [Myxococcales bacterium]